MDNERDGVPGTAVHIHCRRTEKLWTLSLFIYTQFTSVSEKQMMILLKSRFIIKERYANY